MAGHAQGFLLLVRAGHSGEIFDLFLVGVLVAAINLPFRSCRCRSVYVGLGVEDKDGPV